MGEVPRWVHHLADVGAALDDDVKAVVHGLHSIEDKCHQAGVSAYHCVHHPDDVEDADEFKENKGHV